MGRTITQKIIEAHLVSGKYIPGNEIGITIDQTLIPDATGTLACLQFESMKIPRVKNELSVSYIDHNTVQIGFENASDHKYLETIARRYGIYFSRAGNGICHQVHLERFGKPGKTLLGSDSHTPTAGGLGMIGMGAGGMDIAVTLGGEPYYLTCPRVIKVKLTGRLSPWVSAKDIILKVLEIFTTKGNVGYVLEYGGDGVSTLTVPERATITNMGTECGVITSVFPSDEMTRVFLRAEQREEDWMEIQADPNAEYEKIVEINLSKIVPLTATPHSPENVHSVKDVGEIEVDQVCIGSCTNSSYKDLATVAKILKGKIVHPQVSFIVVPGSKQVLENLSRDGYLSDLISAGARIAESACGFCVGNSHSPAPGAVSLRTSNRNFLGRSGTEDANVYLVSPETAAAAVITGRFTDPRDLGIELLRQVSLRIFNPQITGRFTDPRDLGIEYPKAHLPEEFYVDDRMIIRPEDTKDPSLVTIFRAPNIGEPPTNDPFPDAILGEVTIKVGDRITTDHIIPAGFRTKYRSNVAKSSEFVFEVLDSSFPSRAIGIRDEGRHNIIVAGLSYGQGSSREVAALCPMYLGVKAVIAKSFERIHEANLINCGIIPFTFKEQKAYDGVEQGDRIEIPNTKEEIDSKRRMIVQNKTKGTEFEVAYALSERQKKIVFAGGVLNLVNK